MMPRLQIVNRTRGTVVAHRVLRAEGLFSRLRGCLGRNLAPGEGLYLTPCAGVHCLGMTFPIDAISIDRQGRVRKMATLRPWKDWLWDPRGQGILELAAGSCRAGASECRPGDQLAWLPENGW